MSANPLKLVQYEDGKRTKRTCIYKSLHAEPDKVILPTAPVRILPLITTTKNVRGIVYTAIPASINGDFAGKLVLYSPLSPGNKKYLKSTTFRTREEFDTLFDEFVETVVGMLGVSEDDLDDLSDKIENARRLCYNKHLVAKNGRR